MGHIRLGRLSLGVAVRGSPSLLETIGALSAAVDRHVDRSGGRTDLGELAQHAAAESLAILLSFVLTPPLLLLRRIKLPRVLVG